MEEKKESEGGRRGRGEGCVCVCCVCAGCGMEHDILRSEACVDGRVVVFSFLRVHMSPRCIRLTFNSMPGRCPMLALLSL